MAGSEILVVVHAEFLWVETRKVLRHAHKRVIVEHRCKAKWPEVLIENLLARVTSSRYVNILLKSSSRARGIHVDIDVAL